MAVVGLWDIFALQRRILVSIKEMTRRFREGPLTLTLIGAGAETHSKITSANTLCHCRELADDNLELSLTLNSLEEIVPWILSWDKDCEVVSPR